jgi:hypothetical protein
MRSQEVVPEGNSRGNENMTDKPMPRRLDKRPLSDTVAGNWYYGFRCRTCQNRFPVLDDWSEGTAPSQVISGGAIEVICPHCEKIAVYLPKQIERFQLAHNQ